MNYMDQRKAEEKAQDIADGDDSEEEQQQYIFDGKPLSDENLERLMDLYYKDKGLHLNDIEDDDEFKEAWLEWVKDKVPNKYHKAPKKKSEIERFEEQMREQDPEFAAMVE